MTTTKEKLAILFFVLTLIIAIALHSTSGVQVRFENGARVKAEVVEEPLDITTGLMFRDELEIDRGMLFAYGFDDLHSIWMKNMRFPIDIIWIDSNNKIVWVYDDAEPCTSEPCAVYRPVTRARYVLEVNVNFAKENNITPGQTVTITQPSIF